MTDLDNVVLNFSASSLLLMNAILAIVMFSIALDLKTRDFGKLVRAPKPVLTGLVSQFVVLPVLTFLLILIILPHPIRKSQLQQNIGDFVPMVSTVYSVLRTG